jgi:hypothetical protein
LTRPRILFSMLAAVLAASRLCHTGILWEGDTLPLAAARQMLFGKALFRGIWFDKPPLLPLSYLIFGAGAGLPLRLFDAAYCLLACWIAWRFARDLWSEREGLWAAGLLGFFLTFDIPSAVVPVASDLLMLAPHFASVWMAYRRRPVWSGVMAGVAFWISPKGLFAAAASVLWYPAGAAWMAAGWLATSAAAAVWLAASGALGAYWEQVWRWGRLYAGSTFLESPLRNGIVRTVNWMGFHAAAVVAACAGVRTEKPRLRWVGWLVLSLAGVAAGLRFFPRYYFLLLPPVVLLAARGMALLGRCRLRVILLLLVPLVRFAPSYWTALHDPAWRDIAMDRDSRAVAEFVRSQANAGDTLFVWGYRPEIYVYTGMPAATRFLDSQPLTGVPADRHLTQSEPVETVESARRREELSQSRPTFVLDALGLLNPRLAIENYGELRGWISRYRESGRVGNCIVYRMVR